MKYSDASFEEIFKYHPCGKLGGDRCKGAPGCGECIPFDKFQTLLALNDIQLNIIKGISIEEQKKQLQDYLSSVRVKK